MTPKILITLGPSSLTENVVSQLSGPDVHLFRINLSHTPLDMVAETVEKIHKWTDIPLSLDTEGAQMRNETMAGGSVRFHKGDSVKIHHEGVLGDAGNISFTPTGISRQFKPGDRIRVDFDSTCFLITETNDDYCLAEVDTPGKVGSNKAADIDREIMLPPVTEKDKQAVAIGREMGVKHFALSFASCKEHVDQFREITGENSHIISKIESRAGVMNLDGILESTDEILIDRGDLSRQVPIEKIPFMQRRIVAQACSKRVPVNVATNLLESMVLQRNPTRAEVNDVISTLLMGAQGLVLAAETAIGEYPLEVVEMVRKLIDEYSRWTPNTSISDMLNS